MQRLSSPLLQCCHSQHCPAPVSHINPTDIKLKCHYSNWTMPKRHLSCQRGVVGWTESGRGDKDAVPRMMTGALQVLPSLSLPLCPLQVLPSLCRSALCRSSRLSAALPSAGPLVSLPLCPLQVLPSLCRSALCRSSRPSAALPSAVREADRRTVQARAEHHASYGGAAGDTAGHCPVRWEGHACQRTEMLQWSGLK